MAATPWVLPPARGGADESASRNDMLLCHTHTWKGAGMRTGKIVTRAILALVAMAVCAWLALVPAQRAVAEEMLAEDDVALQTITGEGGPRIGITYVAPYGEGTPIQGQVYDEDGGAIDPSAYRIALFLQLGEGEGYWPKPTSDKPYVDVGVDGSFSGQFNTGGNDHLAQILHVMLIPATYTPDGFGKTMDAALDYVRIDRAEDGTVLISPRRDVPAPAGAAPAIGAALPVEQDRIAVDVGFYTDGSAPGSPLSEEVITRQLRAVSRFASTVRFYNAGGEIAKAYAIAHDMGLNVVGTAYLCGDASADAAELDALVEHCNAGLAQVACVGNETLLTTNASQPKLTPAELIGHIRYVRERLQDPSIPVTTSDSVDVLLQHSDVRNACNLMMPNCYPFWGGVRADEAAGRFVRSIAELQAVSGGKQVLVSETGWPTDGGTLGDAVAGEQQAAAYFEAVRSWSLATGTQVLYFQAADEPWKRWDEGSYGAHWGFLTNTFALKDSFAQTGFFQGLGIAAGCTHDVVVDPAVAATCTTAGRGEGKHCSLCGATLEAQSVVPATGHAWGAWTTTKAATETSAGERRRVCANDRSHVETQAIPRLAGPVIALTHTPPYGDGSPFEGIVFREDGKAFSTANYAVTLYLEEPVTHSYWVKPTADQPFVRLGKDGSFSLPYCNPASEATRTRLWLLLLPIGEAQGLVANLYDNAFGQLRANALDCVQVERAAGGGVSLLPARKVSLARATVADIPNKTYTGGAIKPSPVVTVGATRLTAGNDYKVAYTNNTNPGTATVTITGMGGYTGSASKTFKVVKATQAIGAKASAQAVAVGKTASISVSGNKGAVSFASSNAAVATVSSAGKVTAKKVGTVTITVSAAATKTHNAASKKVTVKVVPAATGSLTATNLKGGVKLAWKAVSGATGYKVSCNGTVVATVKGGTNVTYTYAKAKTNGAKYAFRVVAYAATGTSTLSKTVTTYWLAGSAVTSAKSAAARSMTVGWAKDAKAGGYTVQYSTSKTFASGNKTVAISKAGTTSKKITGLAKGKTYYVRVRSRKVVGDVTYHSAWSAAKSVKVS